MSMISEIRAERRADRVVEAEQRRADAAAAADQRRRDQREKTEQAAKRRAARAAKRQAVTGWIGGHPVELLMGLIVVVPGVLAWSAMAAFGAEVYGVAGVLLPLFSEAAMWAFAFALHRARTEGRPTGWLQVGLWTFTAVAAVLNFVHGLLRSVIYGLVMAITATGGVIAHQLITAAPMRTRSTPAERRAARTARIAARRVTAMERRAVRQAAGEVDADGSVRLVYRPGTVRLSRGWTGRSRLVPTVVPGRPVEPAVDEVDAELQALLDEVSEPAGTAKTPSSEAVEGTTEVARELAAQVRQAITAGELPAKPSRRKVQALLGVRASTAQDVIRVLNRGDDGPAEAVAA